MKTLQFLIIIILSISCSEKKHDGHMAKKGMTDEERLMQFKAVNLVKMNDPILDNYFSIQEKFVNDTDDNVRSFVVQLKMAVDASSIENKDKMLAAVTAMENAPDLKELRTAFYPLSTLMIDYAKTTSLKNDLYIMHCPMAFNDTGADWLQNSEKLYNPYFGSRMLTCGSTKSKIAKAE
jgi:hypothetical protein